MSREAGDDVRAAARLGPGALALIVGPSGAGKDALIAGARAALAGDPKFLFPARIVTRPPHSAEDHGSLTAMEFSALARQGGFALTWCAHGLYYGVPASVDGDIRDGRVVVVNGSRTLGVEIRRRYARSCLIFVDCAEEIRAARLALRGRESAAGVRARLMRQVAAFDAADVDVRIDNSGALVDGQRALLEALMSLARAEV